jgi:hypothetical protein
MARTKPITPPEWTVIKMQDGKITRVDPEDVEVIRLAVREFF